MGTTPTLLLPYPEGTDPVGEGDNAMHALADRLEAVIPATTSVKDFGGKGDGVTDDYAALQAFLDYVTANDVGTAYVGGNFVSSAPLTMGAALTKHFAGNCRITFTGTGGVGLTISGWNTGRWEALTLTGPSAAYTDYTSKTWAVGLRLHASSRNTFGQIIGANFNYALVVANTGNVSGNSYGLVKAQDCGSGVLDTGGTRYGVSTSWSNPTNSGSSGSLGQSCTVTVGTLPPAYIAANTYGIVGTDQAFLRITDNSGNKRLHLIRGIDTGTSTLTLFPWVNPAITPVTADYVYGGALCISSGDSNVVEASMVDATRCGIGISMASLYGPHIQRAILQVCGAGVAIGGTQSSASTLGSRFDNMYFENNTEDVIWATNPASNNVSAWFGAESGLNLAKCYVAAAPKLSTTFADSTTYRHFGNTTLAIKGRLSFPEKRSMGGAYSSSTITAEINRPDQRLPLAGNTFTITPSIDTDVHRVTGYDTLMVQVVGTGTAGAPTGTISFPAPSGYTINGGASTVNFTSFTGVAAFLYRFDVVAGNAVVTQTSQTATGSAGLPTTAIAYKAANLTRNNLTRTADPDLTLPVVASGVYVMEAWLAYEATTTADISVAFTAPAGATMPWGRDALTAAATASNSAQGRNRTAALGTPDVLGGVGAGTGVHGNLYGTLFVSTTAGSLTLLWGQSAAEATDAILYAGSWLRLTRVA